MSVKIAGYLRISVDTEVDRDSTSIENQRKIIQDYVKDHFNDYELDFYEDRDRSGYTFTQREDYMRMRPQLMNGDYDILIIKDLSRFSRRNSRGLVELEDLRDAGVRIIAIGDGIDYPTHDDWQHIQVKFLVNEMPIQDASKKVRSVIDNRQKNGQWVCAVPYGYYITNTKTMAYIIDVSAIPVIQEIFDLYISGLGYKKIAEHLTIKKVPTPRMAEKLRKDKERELRGEPPTKIKAGEVWSGATIKEILVNDFYIGTLRQKKYTRKNINGKDVRVEENEQRVFEKWHEAIIDDRTFAKVQELLKTRSKNHYRGKKKYDTTYSGFLFCGDCKSPMFSMSRPDLAPAYTCGSYHKHGKKIDVGGVAAAQRRADDVIHLAPEAAFRVAAVVGRKAAGNIHALGAGGAVAAAGAAHLDFCVNGGHHLLQHGLIAVGQLPGLGGGGGAEVLLQHGHGVHAGKHAGDFFLIPQPAEGPLRRGVGLGMGGKNSLGLLRQAGHQLAAPERLHDHHGQALLMSVLQAPAAGLGVLIQVVVLDQAEIPIVGVDEAHEHLRMAVVGEAYLADSPGLSLLLKPLLNAQGLQAVPGLGIGEHVHQVVIHMIGAQALQFFIEELIQRVPAADEVMGQLGGDVHLMAQVVFLQNLPQGGLTTGVDVGGVKVIDARLNSAEDLPLRFGHVNAPGLAGKAHAAKT